MRWRSQVTCSTRETPVAQAIVWQIPKSALYTFGARAQPRGRGANAIEAPARTDNPSGRGSLERTGFRFRDPQRAPI
jgi:hypothetical protein